MKKVEAIDINELEKYRNKESKAQNDEINWDLLYQERAKSFRNEHTLDRTLPFDKQMEAVATDIGNFNTRHEELLHRYFFLKLFSKAASKDDEFNHEMLGVDHYINNLKRDYDDIKRTFNAFKRRENLTSEELNDFFYRINDLYDFHRGLLSDTENLQEKYYPTLKMSSYSFCNRKSYRELEKLYNNVSLELKNYKNIEDAYDFITLHSGELIVDLVNMFVELPRKVKTSVNYYYFLQTDAIVSFSFVEWLELYAKFIYMKNTIGKSTLYTQKFQKLFEQFEIRYAIVLIYNECSNNK